MDGKGARGGEEDVNIRIHEKATSCHRPSSCVSPVAVSPSHSCTADDVRA